MHYSQRNGTSCGGKVVYVTIGECERAMRKMGSRFRLSKRHRDIAPYHCGPCCGWHFTSMTKGEERDRVTREKPKNDRQTRRVNTYRKSSDQDRAGFERSGALEYAPA